MPQVKHHTVHKYGEQKRSRSKQPRPRTQMLEELTWVPLSKRRENARLILFYKIINNLAMVPHSCLEKADGRTRKNHNLKFRHIGYNVDPYGQSFFPKCISAWNGLAQEIAEANTLDLFKSKLAH